MSNFTGIVEFGSGHQSIVNESDLKSLASILALGAGSGLSTGGTVSSLGAKGATNGAVKMVLDNLPSSIHVQGQLSFTISTLSLTAISANTGSVGTVRVGASYHLSFSEADSSPYGRLWQNSNNEINLQMNTSSDSTVVHQTNQPNSPSSRGVHSLGKGPTTLVTLSWNYGQWELFIDHVSYGIGSRAAAPTPTIFEAIFLGSNRGSGSGDIAEAYYSDFVISNAPVELASHPQLRKVIMFGDSLTARSDPQNQNNMWGHNTSLIVESELRKKGFDAEVRDWVDGVEGATITDSGTPNLQATRTAMLLNNPSLVIFNGGTNDSTNYNFFQANFDTDLKDHITTILANSEDVIIVLCPPASNVGAEQAYTPPQFQINLAAVIEINRLMNLIPEWWDTNNPSDKGRIVMCDVFTVLGGAEGLDDVFEGQIDGLFTDFHYSAKGYKLWGEEIVRSIFKILG